MWKWRHTPVESQKILIGLVSLQFFISLSTLEINYEVKFQIYTVAHKVTALSFPLLMRSAVSALKLSENLVVYVKSIV